ncbi:MAG: response regulator [Nannocystaceae bacterium]
MRTGRILVVDDDPWILRMVCSSLEKQGFVIERAKDGRAGLQRAIAVPPDLIITDLMMPVMDGWTFIQRVRATREVASVPVLFLTALGKDQTKLRAMGLRERDYLAKPFRFADLEQRVAMALGHRHRTMTPVPGQDDLQSFGARPRPAAPCIPPAARTTQIGQVPHGLQTGPEPIDAQDTWSELPSVNDVHVGSGWAPPASSRPAAPPPLRAPPPPRSPGSDAQDDLGSALSGRLEQLGLSGLLVMMELERKGGVLALTRPDNATSGRIFLREGQVIHAKIDPQPHLGGRECVYAMLRWEAGRFSFNAMEVDMDDAIQTSTTSLLMEGARLMDEASR